MQITIIVFQFTHPVRGATSDANLTVKQYVGFNSRTPCGVRRSAVHPSRLQCKFQFTHPVRGATKRFIIVRKSTEVSIHAPRAGCD